MAEVRKEKHVELVTHVVSNTRQSLNRFKVEFIPFHPGWDGFKEQLQDTIGRKVRNLEVMAYIIAHGRVDEKAIAKHVANPEERVYTTIAEFQVNALKIASMENYFATQLEFFFIRHAVSEGLKDHAKRLENKHYVPEYLFCRRMMNLGGELIRY